MNTPPDGFDAKVGANIIKYRDSMALSRQELAEAVGVSRQALWCWETGRSRINLRSAVDVAGELGVTLEKLVGGAE